MSWLLRQLNKVPQPYRLIIFIIMAVAVVLIVLALFSQVRSCGYNKARLEYEQQAKAWQDERNKLLGQIAERDTQIEQLKAKEAAVIAADQAGKKIDDALAAKIDEVTKAASAEEIATNQPTDCWVRADRTCAKLASLKPPIVIDCNVYKRKICSQ